MKHMSDTGRGILSMIVAVSFFATMDAIAKTLAGHYHPLQVVWARYTFHTLIVFTLFAPRLHVLLPTKRLKLQIIRSAFLFCATFSFFTAFSNIGLAQATAVFQVNPLLVTLLGILVLREQAGPRRIVGAGLGLLGALIIIRPGADVFSPYAIIALFGALFYAAYGVSTRFLGREENPMTSLLYTTLFGTVAASLIVPAVWQPIALPDLALMACLGAVGGIGQYFLIRAFTLAEAGAIAPFHYAGFIWAVGYGIFLFGERPDALTLVGALVIVGSGLYVWHRERQAQARSATG